MNVLSLFSGIGAFEKALDRVSAKSGIRNHLVNYCEFDRYASKAYAAIHKVSETKNVGDITQFDPHYDYDIDLVTYGFPCQSISAAGNQKGFFEDNGDLTKSGLFFEAWRVIRDTKPKFAVCENVKNLVSNKFSKEFKLVIDSLDEIGYNNYYKVLDARDYGVPQHRERVFIVSIRKDIDKGYCFPMANQVRCGCIADILQPDTEIDAKHYLSDKMLEKLEWFDREKINSGIITVGDLNKGGQKGAVIATHGVCSTLTATDYKQPKQIAKMYSAAGRDNPNQYRVYDSGYPAPTLSCMQGGGRQPHIPTIDGKIRRLTPLECFRLMGFDDDDYYAVKDAGISDSQCYKVAGNSICVPVLEHIFGALVTQYPNQCK